MNVADGFWSAIHPKSMDAASLADWPLYLRSSARLPAACTGPLGRGALCGWIRLDKGVGARMQYLDCPTQQEWDALACDANRLALVFFSRSAIANHKKLDWLRNSSCST